MSIRHGGMIATGASPPVYAAGTSGRESFDHEKAYAAPGLIRGRSLHAFS
jgi:hypothetical protein